MQIEDKVGGQERVRWAVGGGRWERIRLEECKHFVYRQRKEKERRIAGKCLQLTFTNRGYLRTLWTGTLNRSLSANF